MRKGCLLIVAIVTIGCGSATEKPYTPLDAAGGQCAPPASCVSCIKQSCDSQAKAVFGAGYQSNNFSGGACPNFLACTCNKTDMEKACTQADGANCVTAFAALGACLDTTTCFDSTCKGNSSTGLTVNGNTMDFGPTEVGTAPSRCVAVTGPNASTIAPQILNDTGCTAGNCAFSTLPLYCRTLDSCDACVTFAPKKVGAATATLAIASGLNIALSGVGTGASIPGTGGSTLLATGGTMGTGGIVGSGGAVGTGGTTTISTVDANIGAGGTAGIDAGTGTGGATVVHGGIDGGAGGIVGSGGIVGTGGIIGSGGTTASTSGLVCPLGTWNLSSQMTGCDGAYITGAMTITRSLSGTYILSSSYKSMNTKNANGEMVCGTATSAATSELFNNNTLTYSMSLDSNTCPQKLGIITLTFNPSCTGLVASSITSGCNVCDANGNCSGCGSMTCTSPSLYTAVRSGQ